MIIYRQESEILDDRFVIYTDLKITPGYPYRGVAVGWFNERLAAEDYLSKVHIEVERVYLNELVIPL